MPGIDRRLLQNFEWSAPLLALLLALAGVVNLMSAASSDAGGMAPAAVRQLAWIGMGLLVMFIALVPDYRRLERAGPFIYVAGIVALLAVLAVGPIIKGAQRWLILGPVRLQPSELFKIIMVVVFARLLARRQSNASLGLVDLILPAVILGAPAFLILKQPDLGTAMLVVLTSMSFLLIVPVRLRTVATLGIGGIAFVSVAWSFYLHDYQKQRISTFLNPDLDRLGTAYHAIQSQIAVGSGGLFGKGWGDGSQTQLDFLPEQQTDFVFSVLGEEWGFVGASVILLIYVGLMIRGLMIARASKDLFGAYLAIGVTGMFFWAGTINVGMVIGVLPVVGVPLPLFSYGGSSLLTCMLGIGLLMNVSMRRYLF
jgi:rod shape determining protein RodA